MGVAEGIMGGAALLGAGTSIWSSNQASDAVSDASDQTARSTDKALALQAQQYNDQKKLNEPFYNASLPSYYQLVDAISGKRQRYLDPNNPLAQGLSEQDLRAANIQAIMKARPDLSEGEVVSAMEKYPEGVPYQSGTTYYRDASGNITTQAPQGAYSTTEAFNPTETSAYKWQQQQANQNNSRTLRALGRENSSYGMGEQFKTQQNLASAEYDKQLGRLADLTNIARGGASSLASAGNNYANTAGGMLINNGNNQANATLAGNQIQQNGLYNGIQSGMSLANLGLKAYNSGAWAGGGGGSGWSTTNGAYGDSSYNGNGQLWD